MARELLMGNEAIGLGAIRAGVSLVAGYPGTPSTEILETVAKHNQDGAIHVEWSVNEKAALEVAAGASYAGARTLVTMKQVGLNVASDPLMSLAYVGVEGGMVIVSADDPGPISSQTEQDTRHFGAFSKLPVFDPSSPEEAYEMVEAAFACSEEYKTPVLLRPTTRVCHGCASIEVKEGGERKEPKGFVKDTGRWVIFPRLSYQNHKKIEARNEELSRRFSESPFNRMEGRKEEKGKGIAAGGVSYAYVKESLPGDVPLLKIGTPHPFPEELAVRFLEGLSEVLVLEELDPAGTVTVSEEAVDLPAWGSSADLEAGEELTVDDVLYALMLPSANEAANVLAEAVDEAAGRHLLLTGGSQLPGYRPDGSFRVGASRYRLLDPRVAAVAPVAESVMDTASRFLGCPYLWGGKDAMGIDCSGLTQVVFRIHGIPLRRNACQQAEQGVLVPFLQDARPGDLAFFDHGDGSISHVGFVAGGGRVLHASGNVHFDLLDSEGIYSVERGFRTHHLRFIKRMD